MSGPWARRALSQCRGWGMVPGHRGWVDACNAPQNPLSNPNWAHAWPMTEPCGPPMQPQCGGVMVHGNRGYLDARHAPHGLFPPPALIYWSLATLS